MRTLNGVGGIEAVLDIARTRPSGEICRRAVKIIGEVVPPRAAVGVLDAIANGDSDHAVQQKAAEELGRLRSTQTLPSLARLARTHPNVDVREEAVEQYSKRAVPESALLLLKERLAIDPADTVQTDAIDRLDHLT